MSRDAGLEQDPGHRDAGRAGAGDHHPRGRRASRPVSRSALSQRGQRDDRGAVLVVVEDRDVEPLLEPLLDLEAARRRDVLEVDAAEARREPDDGLDDLVDVGGVQADRHGVDAAELLEQHRLALHHRHRGGRADVAEAEHGGAVGDDGDRVRHPGVVAGSAPGRRRSPRTPGPRRGCRPATGRRGRRAATVEAISILPPRCRSKTGSPARSGGGVSGLTGVCDIGARRPRWAARRGLGWSRTARRG